MGRKKKILIISPQSWTNFFNSKHHYSIGLSNMGYDVYFLNPLQYLNSKQILLYKIKKNKFKINVINIKFFLPSFFNQINNFFLKFFIIKISSILRSKFDIVWCFDEKNFQIVNLFKSKKKILQIMDPIKINIGQVNKVDFNYIISISNKLIDKNIRKKIIYTNHGLSKYFLNYKLNKKNKKKNQNKIIGLYGNFLSGRFDLNLVNKLIISNSNLFFFFFGNIDANHPYKNIKKKKQILSDIERIKLNHNVRFFGNLSQNVLAKKLDKCDLFIYPSKLKKNIDAHKLVELIYLGKPIVTTKFQNYSNSSDLLYFTENHNFKSFDLKLNHVIKNYNFYNSYQLYKKRKKFALNRNYKKLIAEILKKIDE